MNEERLAAMIEQWEPTGAEVVRVIDTYDRECERIVKYESSAGERYALYRYFEIGISMDGGTATDRTEVSVDLVDVDADRVIQHLAERL